MRLLDSDVVIDVFRGYPPALLWMRSQQDALVVCGLTVMELLAGSENTRAVQQLQRQLKPFPVYWPTAQDCDRALTTFARGHLSHNPGILDALIGECAVGLGVSLVTFNVKHFRAMTALTIEQPYGRG